MRRLPACLVTASILEQKEVDTIFPYQATSFETAMTDRSSFQLFMAKGITDDVQRQALHALLIVRFDFHFVMNAETGNILPSHYHFDEGSINQPSFLEQLKSWERNTSRNAPNPPPASQ